MEVCICLEPSVLSVRLKLRDEVMAGNMGIQARESWQMIVRLAQGDVHTCWSRVGLDK